ncbi:MAG: ABC transporter ATP-binding protein [Leptolyngbyaceae cyanobacterium SM2_5_2]|nr:ABC transporter ATP-binding protein [Leptolyngbyaceae cyanobacterium SM2_5_2]
MLFRGKKQYFREFWALKDVSFEVKPGETFGVIGRNGSGKSTLLQILAGTLASTCGDIEIHGRIAALLELGSGFNPEFTGRENVFLNGRILGLSKEDIEDRFEQIQTFAEIGEYIDQPVKTYSSGMFVRLAFAVQAHIDANIVIIDEALAVGDVFFRQKCYSRLEQLRQSGTAILLVSHSMGDIEQYCKRAILLNQGHQEFIGPASEAVQNYYLLYQSSGQSMSPPSQLQIERIPQSTAKSKILPPPEIAFISLGDKSQVKPSETICTGVALCNAQGEPRRSFRQGDVAVFYYEFELRQDIEVPVCGIVLKNDHGIIVHGKNSWQVGNDCPAGVKAGSKVICQQSIKLDLQLGEYIIEVGLASIDAALWQRRDYISHEEISPQFYRLCYVPNAGAFAVELAIQNGVGILTHHGVADLPGDITIEATPALAQDDALADGLAAGSTSDDRVISKAK